MSFFVWRKDHEDLKRQLAVREAELRHIIDLMWKQGFGVQLFDTLSRTSEAEEAAQAAPTPKELTPEDELEAERAREVAELTSISRTSPSKLGPALARLMARDQARAVKAAHPDPNNRVTKAFEQARKEVS